MSRLKGKLERWLRHPAFYALLLLWALIWLTWPARYDTLDSVARFHVAKALVEQQTIETQGELNIMKAATWYSPGVDGKRYCAYPLGHSLLMAPLYWLIRTPRAGTMVCPLLFPAMFLLLYSILRRGLQYRRWPSLIAASAAIMTTMIWPYARFTHDVFIQSTLVLGAVRLLLITDRRAWWAPLAAGALWGANLNLHPMAVLTLPALIVLLAVGRRRESWERAALFLLGSLPLLALAGWYNYRRFGNLLGTVPGALSSNFFDGSLYIGLLGLLVSPAKSVFLYSPPLIGALLLWPRFFRRHGRLALSMALLAACYLLGFGKFQHWHGDWAWGPRYLLPVIAPLMLCWAEFWSDQPLRRAWRFEAGALLAAGLLVQLAASSLDYSRVYREKKLSASFHVKDARDTASIYFDSTFVPVLMQLAAWPMVLDNTIDGLRHEYRQTKASVAQHLANLAARLKDAQRANFQNALALYAPVEQLSLDYFWQWQIFIMPKLAREKLYSTESWGILRETSPDNLALDYWWLANLLSRRELNSAQREMLVQAIQTQRVPPLLCYDNYWICGTPGDSPPPTGETAFGLTVILLMLLAGAAGLVRTVGRESAKAQIV